MKFKKINLLIIIILLSLSSSVFGFVASFPLVDEAKILDQNNYKIGGGFGFSHKLFFAHKSFTEIDTYIAAPFIEYTEKIYDDEYHQIEIGLETPAPYIGIIIPIHSLSFNYSRGIKNNIELGFAFYLSTPDILLPRGDFNCFGPTFQAQFLFKKQIINSSYVAGSYKFSLIAEYNGAFGFNAGIKNSILLGNNDNNKTHNFIFSIYTYAGYSWLDYYLDSYSIYYTGIIPQFEYCLSKSGENNFNSSSSIFLESNIKYIFYHEKTSSFWEDFEITPTFDNIIRVTINFGYEFRFQKR